MPLLNLEFGMGKVNIFDGFMIKFRVPRKKSIFFFFLHKFSKSYFLLKRPEIGFLKNVEHFEFKKT